MTRFVIPLPPNRANARGHTRWMNRAKKDYWKALDNIQAFGTSLTYGDGFSIPKPPAEPHEKVETSAVLYVWNAMDHGNAMNRLKWIEDWIVRAGYVVDDSPEHWEWTAIPRQQIDRSHPRVELTMEAA